MKKIIEVRDLKHNFGDLQAVDNISFEVYDGEIFSFLGPNGAGKSTTINILITLLKLQEGIATIAGNNVQRDPAAIRKSIGIVFQNEVLDRDLTVWEILEFHGRIYQIPKNERKEIIEELLNVVDLEQKRDTRIKYLSGGMKRRLEIARGLMTRPKVLFLDEPTVGLDPQTRLKIWDYIRDINDSGTTIFLTTHYMDEADHLSDRIGIIDKGKIITIDSPDQLKNSLGRDVIYVNTSDNEKAKPLLEKITSIYDISESVKGIALLTAMDGTMVMPSILDVIKEGGLEIISINLKKPTMDDVFVHYTGKEIRNEPTDKVHPRPGHHGRR
ncbi:MAG: ATP-binding cassette domain-containing protein [Methanomicrobiaceae archaeon]|nr:ATP-binding cassette domain-containing protein [Methanomicrobiaceae archaeon]